MNPFDSDSSDDGDQQRDYIYNLYDNDTLHNCTQSLGLHSSYVPSWRPPHAIREYHQNWKDGIKEASGLESRDFKILDKGFNAKDVYTIEARHPDTDKLLGFVSWQSGTVQYTNFGAKLERKALSIGSSTKRDSEHLAGTHGEGFKVASLVMLRYGYRVRFESSSYYWNFRLGGRDNDILTCRLSEVNQQKLAKQKAEYAKTLQGEGSRGLQANIWEDVTVKIGEILGKGVKVKKDDFLKWIKVSLDMNHLAKIITTPYGRLILDKEFRGKIYLKGLLLEGECSLPFKFGYDFYNGEVNRDRERLSNPTEEAITLAKIWGEAVKLDEDAAVPELLALFQEDNKWGDVNLAERYISLDTARKIWQMLLGRNTEGELFYYCSQNGDKDIELITKSLQKKPFPLNKATWLSLRNFKLIRTPEEQRCHLLQSAPESTIPKSLYSEDATRVLRSVLALDPRTRDLYLEFKSGAKAELDVLLRAPNLLVNDKFLDFRLSHKKSTCSVLVEATAAEIEIERFSCSHIMKNLHDLILLELSKGEDAQLEQSPYSDNYFRQVVSERIDHMPHMVQVTHGDTAGVLEVSWVHPESEKISQLHHLELKGRVTLHRESTCADMKTELLTSGLYLNDSPSREVDEPVSNSTQVANGCGCKSKVIFLKDSRAVFDGLDHEEEYFPMVARTDYLAFFALPPKAISPLAPPDETSSRSVTPWLCTASPLRTSPIENKGAVSNFSDRDEDDMYCVSSSEKSDDSDHHPSNQSPVNSVGPSFNIPSTPTRRSQEIRRLEQQIEGQRRALAGKDAQLRDFADEKENLLDLLSIKEDELRGKKEQLEEVNLSISSLEKNDEDASMTIDTLKRDIQRLQHENETLEAELDMMQDINDKQAQLAANRAARLSRGFSAGVKREIKDEEDGDLPRPPAKLARRSHVITTSAEGIIELE